MSSSLLTIATIASAFVGTALAGSACAPGTTSSTSPASSFSFTTVPGYFAQDLNSTVPSTFDYSTTNFGLLNITYPTDRNDSKTTQALTQWQRFARYLTSLNTAATPGTSYKLIWFGRHGEGYHNAAETFYGTPAWNCYWAELNGNTTATWADAHLTPNGVAQAQKANAFWASELQTQKIPAPQAFYTSPLWRCLTTANLTFAGLDTGLEYNGGVQFIPTVKELLREGISIHTCDRRSDRSTIAVGFPNYLIEPGFAESDGLWNGVTAETSAAQDVRSAQVLNEILTEVGGKTYVSVTSHSGEIASLLRVLGHRVFSLSTGAIIPVLVKVQVVQPGSASTTTSFVAATTSPHCTSPPVSSVAGGADGGCVCQNGASPVTSTLAGNGPTSSA